MAVVGNVDSGKSTLVRETPQSGQVAHTNRMYCSQLSAIRFFLRKLNFTTFLFYLLSHFFFSSSAQVGVLTGGENDDGRGKARQQVVVHRHEASSGRTSCISQVQFV